MIQAARLVGSCQQANQIATLIKWAKLADVATHVKAAKAKVDAEKRAAQLEAVLKDKPGDAMSAAALAKVYLVELDKPETAARLADACGDEGLKANLKLAGGKPEDVPVEECRKLADWYRSLAADASICGKGVAYSSAKFLYAQFLTGHGKQDLDALEAKKAQDEVAKEIAKLPTFCVPVRKAEPAVRPGLKGPTSRAAVTEDGPVSDLGAWQVTLPASRPGEMFYWVFKPGGVLIDTYVSDATVVGDGGGMRPRFHRW